MMSTLDRQRQRLHEELAEAEEQLQLIQREPCPNLRIMNYYHDMVARHRQLLEMLDGHLVVSAQQSAV